ncbi:MAG: Stringent starvation protein B [Methylobacterium sp.]|nr:Stringent starvation protein B [Methylobacterium sp.]MCA3650725.1 Stringent starvation protein B [Methylobacterium sp.]MCA4923350.1 Stringent starvation protein B [Methylobacterium sp.]
MTEPASEDLIRYDVMVQQALIGVVRKVLQDGAKHGLPGEHHFYISFRTDAPGVRLSSRLKEKHPDEMTIVLQHQFWDLLVTDHAFEVGLSFGGVPERLLIPFEAMTGFFDPSVQFGLKFAVDEALADNDAEADDEGEGSARDTLEQISAREKSSTGKPKPIDADNIEAAKAPPATKKTRKPKSEPAEKDARKTEAASPAPKGDDAAAPPAGAEVVSLEAFRKKK